MSKTNKCVNHRIQEHGFNEWIVRRVDEANKFMERYIIVRIDANNTNPSTSSVNEILVYSLELGYECECSRSDQRGSMSQHILACIKEAKV